MRIAAAMLIRQEGRTVERVLPADTSFDEHLRRALPETCAECGRVCDKTYQQGKCRECLQSDFRRLRRDVINPGREGVKK